MLLIFFQLSDEDWKSVCAFQLCYVTHIIKVILAVHAGMPGVVRVLTVADIPSTGKNDIGANAGQEKMFLEVGDTIGCVGQSVALVMADTFAHALAASRFVTITVLPPASAPILSIPEAIAANSFFPQSMTGLNPILKGDVDAGKWVCHRQ